MSKKQKMIVGTWAAIFFTLVLLAIFDEWVQENWDSIRWPSFIIILIIAAFSQKQGQASVSEGRHNINEIVNNHPWIKLYMIIYCLIVAIVCFNVVSKGVNLSESIGTIELALAIFGIMLPIFIVQQIQLYRDAG